MIRIRRALAVRSDSGLTLTELVMGMAITALALAMVGAFFTNIMRNTTDNRGERQASGAAANAMDEIGRVIRTAADIPVYNAAPMPAVASGSGATSVTVLAYVDVDPQNPVPSKVSFTVDASGNVVEQRVVGVQSGGYWTFTTGLQTSRTLPGPLSVSFTYWNDSLDTPAQVLPTTDALASNITSVKVTVTAPRSGWGIKSPVVLTSTALMPNTTIN